MDLLAAGLIKGVAKRQFTHAEFRRTLRPGGIAHAIDWSLTVVEPIAAECARWWTQRDGRGGRRILAESSMASRVAPAALTVAGYAREGGTVDSARIDSMLETLDRSLADGTYLTVVPQFLVTSTR